MFGCEILPIECEGKVSELVGGAGHADLQEGGVLIGREQGDQILQQDVSAAQQHCLIECLPDLSGSSQVDVMILGELAERLHHTDEAVEAYENCLQIKFSPKAMKGVLKLGEDRRNTRDTCAALIRLVTWQYRLYSEVRSTPRCKHLE